MKGRLRLSYVLTLCLAFMLAVAVPLLASAEMIEEWVARYNSPSDGHDSANAIVVDPSGNVYVTGEGEYDYVTVKYDTDGNQLWVARYNGPGNGYDEAHAIAVDASGNVYVTGGSEGSGTDYDYATVKYDTDGNQLWVKRYNGPGNDYDGTSAIAIDASGNVYVTGHSDGSGTCTDYATVKYDSSGNELWVARYNGPGNWLDNAYSIAVDASGNVYVTGQSGGSGTGDDYATVKYDGSGNELWVARYNGPGSDDDKAHAITIDPSGNVYVTGGSGGKGTYEDYATVKYDTDGNELWVKRYNGPADGEDRAEAIAVDSSGNVYVTGVSRGSGTYGDYATVKYDADGNQLWVARYNGPENGSDSASVIAVDSSGNVYATGYSYGSGIDCDYATVKYDADGNQLWVHRYNGPANGRDYVNAIALDSLGNVYVTGESPDSGTYGDYATVKYDTDGNQLWVARYNGPADGEDRAEAITVDALGNVYVTGVSRGRGTGDDYATVKYDIGGNQLWVKRYNGPGNDRDEANAMAVDTAGNVYVTGWSAGSGTSGDYATVKYDANGNQLWVKRYNGPENHDDWAYAIAVDPLGNVYVTGTSEYDYATVKYDTHGNQLWVARYNGPGNGSDEARAIAVDTLGNVCVTGWSYGSGTRHDYATVKYDTHGNQLWVKRYNGPENECDAATAIAVDTSGNVYVTGVSYGGSGTRDDYATVKYDTHGNQLWEARYNGPENGSDSASVIAVDSSGNVYVTGESLGIGTDWDYATVKYDTDGNELWVKRYNGPGNYGDYACTIAVDASGNVYVTGGSKGSGTGGDYATVKYDTYGNQLWVARYNGPGNGNDSACAIAVDALGNVYVTGGSEGIGTDSDYATVKYGEGLPAGWSMMSLPVRPEVATVSTLFPEAVVMYKYQKGMGYVRVPAGGTLEVGVGYWILLDTPQPYLTEGTEITEYTTHVEDGWYMIGGCSMPADKMVTSGKIVVIYGYTQGIGYTRVPRSQLLERGKGYWILFSNTAGGAEFTASTAVAK